jgi:thioredoxin reductase (NADPH)
LQLTRSDVPVTVIAEEIGGLVHNANLVENLLGFPKGITGNEFIDRMNETLARFRIHVLKKKVTYVKKSQVGYQITTKNSIHQCNFLIVGTGTTPKRMNIPGEKEAFENQSLFFDISRFKSIQGKLKIGIIGSGDAAYDYALNLAQSNHMVDILQRNVTSKALTLLKQRVSKINSISVRTGIQITSIKSNADGVELTMQDDSRIFREIFQIVFVTIGREPAVSFLSPDLVVIFNKYYQNKWEMDKSKNLWFIGDIINKQYRQIAISMADGLRTAMRVSELIQNLKK